MIGLIVWAILIIVIAECACPGLLRVTFICLAIYGALYVAFVMIVDKIKSSKHKK